VTNCHSLGSLILLFLFVSALPPLEPSTSFHIPPPPPVGTHENSIFMVPSSAAFCSRYGSVTSRNFPPYGPSQELSCSSPPICAFSPLSLAVFSPYNSFTATPKSPPPCFPPERQGSASSPSLPPLLFSNIFFSPASFSPGKTVLFLSTQNVITKFDPCFFFAWNPPLRGGAFGKLALLPRFFHSSFPHFTLRPSFLLSFRNPSETS